MEDPVQPNDEIQDQVALLLMCGIAESCVSTRQSLDPSAALGAALAHRGPDGFGRGVRRQRMPPGLARGSPSSIPAPPAHNRWRRRMAVTASCSMASLQLSTCGGPRIAWRAVHDRQRHRGPAPVARLRWLQLVQVRMFALAWWAPARNRWCSRAIASQSRVRRVDGSIDRLRIGDPRPGLERLVERTIDPPACWDPEWGSAAVAHLCRGVLKAGASSGCAGRTTARAFETFADVAAVYDARTRLLGPDGGSAGAPPVRCGGAFRAVPVGVFLSGASTRRRSCRPPATPARWTQYLRSVRRSLSEHGAQLVASRFASNAELVLDSILSPPICRRFSLVSISRRSTP
jgi:hypothetical protein